LTLFPLPQKRAVSHKKYFKKKIYKRGLAEDSIAIFDLAPIKRFFSPLEL
jgi:hypothetical protein